MLKISLNAVAQSAAALALIVAFTQPADASYIHANINAGADGGACGSVNPDVGEPCAGFGYTGSVGVDAGFAKAMTDFGINKVASASGNALSEWMVAYTLLGGTPGSSVDLIVNIAYDVTLSAGALTQAEFRMVLNNNSLFPFIIRDATNGLGDRCDDRAPSQQADCGAGNHNGVYSQTITATVAPNNRLTLSVQAGLFGSGSVDAFNTVTVQSIIVPNGISWQYQGIAGNPLNFQHATTAVPEPATLWLVTTGLAGVVVRRRRVR